MKTRKKFLIIIQRSNGDVFLSATLIHELYKNFNSPKIDLLVNEDTYQLANLIPNINSIHTFSYEKKKNGRWLQEKQLIAGLFRKYDLCINLTASDRSVIYALLAGKKTISAVEESNGKSWWKKILLSHYYVFDNASHILLNNLKPLHFLKINHDKIQYPVDASKEATRNIKKKLKDNKVDEFIIFHPSSQYNYKVYPENLRNELITYLNDLGVKVLITGGNTSIDLSIKNQIPLLSNIVDFIGETSLDEFFALSQLSLGYIGMDTLNMHIAASQNKRIFAIFGPTNLRMWSPWENQLKLCANEDKPIQNYGNVTVFQADLPCVACGNAGCNDDHGVSVCLNNISPKTISDEIKDWLFKSEKIFKIQVSMDKV